MQLESIVEFIMKKADQQKMNELLNNYEKSVEFVSDLYRVTKEEAIALYADEIEALMLLSYHRSN